MKIVIDIPEDIYLLCKYLPTNDIHKAIANGTPLPKEHGRLIDADAYQTKLEEKATRLKNLDTINGLCGAVGLLIGAETIIEADKEKKNESNT